MGVRTFSWEGVFKTIPLRDVAIIQIEALRFSKTDRWVMMANTALMKRFVFGELRKKRGKDV